MSKTQTRYNSFILDPTGKYSCPSCYRLGGQKIQSSTDLQCSYCGTRAPIAKVPSNGSAVAISTSSSTGIVLMEFQITTVDSNYHYYRCPKCSYLMAGAKGMYAATCSSCIFTAPVSYRDICNACLMGSNKLVQAEYLCSNPAGRHTPGHNTGLKIAGKCTSHRCSYDCKKI